MIDFKDHVERSFERAERCESKITRSIKAMDGMTGQLTRHLYNNLLDFEDAVYLEVGTWKGSSCFSALCGHKVRAVLIDNFTSFGSPREDFFDNLDRFRGGNEIQFFDKDCFDLDPLSFGLRFNVYLFDGDHEHESQRRALSHFLPALQDTFIFIVDDWNWPEPRSGTYAGIEECRLEVVHKKEIRTTTDNSHTHQHEGGLKKADETWWNGVAVFVLRKTR